MEDSGKGEKQANREDAGLVSVTEEVRGIKKDTQGDSIQGTTAIEQRREPSS